MPIAIIPLMCHCLKPEWGKVKVSVLVSVSSVFSNRRLEQAHKFNSLNDILIVNYILLYKSEVCILKSLEPRNLVVASVPGDYAAFFSAYFSMIQMSVP